MDFEKAAGIWSAYFGITITPQEVQRLMGLCMPKMEMGNSAGTFKEAKKRVCLSRDKAAEIKWLCRHTTFKDEEIAPYYGVGRSTVNAVRHDRSHNHVKPRKPDWADDTITVSGAMNNNLKKELAP